MDSNASRIQSELKYLPRPALEYISRKLDVSLSEVISIASFYHQFRLELVGDCVISDMFWYSLIFKRS
uniref:Uncharacterized protein n=1 Tax=Ignisphaera aggregans TaxID=334771 RepID=A0A7C2ZNH1_9CREN